MKKRLIIFDLDGTLLNTIADIASATNAALLKLGYPTHSDSVIQSFVGNGIGKLLERALPEDKRTEENKNIIRQHFTAHYDKHNTDLSTPYPGIEEMLFTLHKAGVMLAVASNKYQIATEKLVSHYFPGIEFISVLGQRTGIPIKPDPEIVHEIMTKANVSKANTLYIGDSGVDMQTAHNSGIDAVAVSWGFRTREELLSYNPLAIVNHAEELEQLILHQED